MCSLEDYSDVTDIMSTAKINYSDIMLPTKKKKSVNVNLGMYIDRKGRVRTDKYCGYIWLVDKDGNHIKKDDNNDEMLIIKPRFGLDMSVMVRKIFEDDEFFAYLGLETEEPLFTFFHDEKLIEVGENDDSTGQLLAVVSFVELLERATRHSLLKKMIRIQENNVGRIRGRIVINKHLSNNIFQAHDERIYCEHNERTIDIKENQLLKYALKKALKYVENFNAKDDVIARKINIIMNRLKGVKELADSRVSHKEVDKVKYQLPNMYKNYIPIFEYAKIIIEGASVLSTSEGSKKIVPYAVNSHMLFECYARACVKEQIKNLDYVKMLKYVPDKNNIPTGEEYGAIEVLKESNNEVYIDGKIVPDIVLEYKKDDGVYYRVYDVKYKDVTKPYKGRDDRLQLLAYNFMYNGDDNTGFILPKQDNKCSTVKKIDINKAMYGSDIFISASANNEGEIFDYWICLPAGNSCELKDLWSK